MVGMTHFTYKNWSLNFKHFIYLFIIHFKGNFLTTQKPLVDKLRGKY
jgi:hypothetical protein